MSSSINSSSTTAASATAASDDSLLQPPSQSSSSLSLSTNTEVVDNSKTSERVAQTHKDKHSVTKRLQQELLSLMMSGEKGVSAFPDGDNLFRWIGTIQGPSGTVYDGLEFKLLIEFPNSYPITAPRVKFDTVCFHPNVDDNGNICLDILKEKWSATYDALAILLSIQSLLSDPNLASALNHQAADQWKNPALFKKSLHEKYNKEKELKRAQEKYDS